MPAKTLVLTCLITAASLGATSPAHAKTLIDYFQPTPIIGKLTSSTWGAAGVLPRDIQNGLEDATIKSWCYWDGKIIRAADGKYHLFGSRWDQSKGHAGWSGSVAIHAVSDTSPLGPYVDKGLAYTDQNGKGHNVTANVLPDGRYAILVSETRPGDVFISSSLDGPWVLQGSIKVDANGFDATGTTSNLSLVVRPDGSYLIVSRHGILMLSTTGILGPYKVQGPSVYPTVTGIGTAAGNANAEDPLIWYSGGQYHILFNYWDVRKAYHLTSTDGIKNWKNMGLAYDPTLPYIRYTDGTVNIWNKIERPGVLIENGHVTHFTFAVVDVPKEQELGNDNHGSKIIVVPFDGAAFDAETGAGAGGMGGGGASGRGGASGGGGRGGSTGSGGAGATGGSSARGGTTGTGGAAGMLAVDAGSGSAGEAGGLAGAGGGGGEAGTGMGTGGTAPVGAGGTFGGAAGASGGSSARGGSGASGGSGGTGAGGVTGPGETSSASGCACGIGDESSGATGGALAAVAHLGLTLIRRRRRRRS